MGLFSASFETRGNMGLGCFSSLANGHWDFSKCKLLEFLSSFDPFCTLGAVEFYSHILMSFAPWAPGCLFGTISCV